MFCQYRMAPLGVRSVSVAAVLSGLSVLCCASIAKSQPQAASAGHGRRDSHPPACVVVADSKVTEPVTAIAKAYSRRTGNQVTVDTQPARQLADRIQDDTRPCDVVVWMEDADAPTLSTAQLKEARKVAWKYPTGEPVRAVALSDHPDAQRIVQFLGGPTGHRLWSESKAGFTITTGKTHAEAFDWVVENRVKHTYPLTGMRMLREIGGMREGICIDIGCGTGNLDVEIAKRSEFRIIGLDIDADMEPLFQKRIREAGLQDRVSFVTGDAQALPFADNYADVIVSRGVLPFIPDLGKCLREVDRVLKPTGVAFLGGRYVYTPQEHKIPTDRLREIVKQTGIQGASVIENRGQWVKIVGPQAPPAAKTFQGGLEMLAGRIVADYGIIKGKCLLILGGDGPLQQALERGLVDLTAVEIIAMYPKDEVADSARQRIGREGRGDRIKCCVGNIEQLPFPADSFDLVAGVGPVLIWIDRTKSMQELYRVLRSGGAALVGGRYLHMPDFRRVSSETLRSDAAATGIPSIRIVDDMGQWVEIRKGIGGRKYRD